MPTTMSLVIVTVAESLALASASLAAVIVIFVLDGIIAGARYWPVAETVPDWALPPETPFTLQVTAVFVAPVTLAWKFTVAPSTADALAGEIFTTTFCCPPPPPPSPPVPLLTVPPHPATPAITASSRAIRRRLQPMYATRMASQQVGRQARPSILCSVRYLPSIESQTSHSMCHSGADLIHGRKTTRNCAPQHK